MMWRYQCDARDERDEGDTDELKDVDTEYKEGQLVEGVRAVVVEHNGGKAENPLEDVVRDRVDVRREHDWRRNWILWWKNGRNYFVILKLQFLFLAFLFYEQKVYCLCKCSNKSFSWNANLFNWVELFFYENDILPTFVENYLALDSSRNLKDARTELF